MVITFRNLDQCSRLRQFFRLQGINCKVCTVGSLKYRFDVENLNHEEARKLIDWLIEHKLLETASLTPDPGA